MKRRSAGSAMLLSIFFLIVLFFLALSLLKLLPVELNATQRQMFNLEAYYAADAGITEAMAWLEKRLSLEQEPSLSFTVSTGANAHHEMNGTLGEWKWVVDIRPDPETPPRGTSSVRIYRITATAKLFDTVYRKVIVDAGQESFAKFGLFYDKGGDGLVWDVSRNRIEGPMHQNDVLRIYVPSGYFESDGDPAFTGEVSSDEFYGTKGDGVEYVGGGGKPYQEDGSPIPERYQRMLTGGREALRTGEKTKEMPTNSRNLAEAAWGSKDSAPPSTTGVYVNSAVGDDDFPEAVGGVFIQGDVDKMVLGVSGGNSTTKIKQGSQETLVTVVTEAEMTLPSGARVNGQATSAATEVPVGHTVVKKQDGSYQVVKGVTNGVFYATGDINGLEGVNKGRRTVAVDIQNDKDIVLTGDLTRSDTTVGEKPTGTSDTLGVVGFNVRIGRNVPRTTSDPLYLYCTIFSGRKDANGGFVVDGWNEDYGQVGKFIIHGGLIEGEDKPWGYVGASGFSNYEIHYDPSLAAMPPPHFPMLPKLHIRSWTEETQQGTQIRPD